MSSTKNKIKKVILLVLPHLHPMKYRNTSSSILLNFSFARNTCMESLSSDQNSNKNMVILQKKFTKCLALPSSMLKMNHFPIMPTLQF